MALIGNTDISDIGVDEGRDWLLRVFLALSLLFVFFLTLGEIFVKKNSDEFFGARALVAEAGCLCASEWHTRVNLLKLSQVATLSWFCLILLADIFVVGSDGAVRRIVELERPHGSQRFKGLNNLAGQMRLRRFYQLLLKNSLNMGNEVLGFESKHIDSHEDLLLEFILVFTAKWLVKSLSMVLFLEGSLISRLLFS